MGRPRSRGRGRPRARGGRRPSTAVAAFEKPVERGRARRSLESGPERLSRFRDRIEEDRTENAKRFATFKERVASAVKAERWFDRPRAAGARSPPRCFGVAGVVLLVVGIHGFRPVAPRWSDIVLIAVGACLVAATRCSWSPRPSAARLWRAGGAAGRARGAALGGVPSLPDATSRASAMRRPPRSSCGSASSSTGSRSGSPSACCRAPTCSCRRRSTQASSIYWIGPYGSDLGSGPSAARRSPTSRPGFGSALAPPSSARAAVAAASRAAAEAAEVEGAGAPGEERVACGAGGRSRPGVRPLQADCDARDGDGEHCEKKAHAEEEEGVPASRHRPCIVADPC